MYIYIYIYIYVCVCVCMHVYCLLCLYIGKEVKLHKGSEVVVNEITAGLLGIQVLNKNIIVTSSDIKSEADV